MARILVVDDEVEVTKSLLRLLRSQGFDVETATSPVAALVTLEAFRPDVVISDFRMPELTGAELLVEVKRRLPLSLRIILSGHADLDAVLASINQGEACRFIRKPWDNDEPIACLRHLLGQRELLAPLYHPFQRDGAATAEALQEQSRLVIRARLAGSPFTVDQAVTIISKFAGALEEGDRTLVGGLLERHAGKPSFVAEVGGDQRLTVELPMRDVAAAEEVERK